MAGLCTPLPTLRRRPCGRLRTARGQCGSLLLHRKGLPPSTPCRSPGALRIAPIFRYYPSALEIDRRTEVLDGVSLDQLRSFIAAVDEGSFSAAARRLRRAQSAVSELVSNLEDQIGVMLFDRSGRYPKLTSEGAVLLADARGIVAGVDFMKARAKGIAAGLEPELSVVIDV